MVDDLMSGSATEPAAAVRQVAELASRLAAIDPTARETVRELFAAFSEVQNHFSRPEPIESAPLIPGATLLLFCPEQRGWQAGEWRPGEPGRWMSTLALNVALRATHWRRPVADPIVPVEKDVEHAARLQKSDDLL